MEKNKVHYSFMNWCCSFMPACSSEGTVVIGGDFQEFTDDEVDVTCEECIKALKEIANYGLGDPEFEAMMEKIKNENNI